MRNPIYRPAIRAALLMVLLLLAACGTEEPITPEEAGKYVDEWAPSVENTLTERTEGAPIQKELQTIIEKAAEKEKARTTRDEPPYPIFLQQVYAELDYLPKLVEHGELTPAGQAVWDAIQTVDDHAMDPEHYPVDQLEERLEKLSALREGTELPSLEPTAEERQFAVAWVQKQDRNDFALDKENHATLTDALLESSTGARLNEALGSYEKLGEKLAAESANVEYLLAFSLGRYARQMKYFKLRKNFIHPREDDYYNDPETRSTRPDKAKGPYLGGVIWRRAAAVAEEMADPIEINHGRIRATLTEVLEGDSPKETIHGLWPGNPQYTALVKENRRYGKIVEDGGWEEVPVRKKLGPGDSDPVAKALKERLRIEGYYPESAPIDENYDEHLEKAVTDYQTTHQMEVTGKPHNMFWSSVNVPAERRKEQIEMNLRRWRDSNIDHSKDMYVLVNVPDFHAEVWENQERKMRFGIIVGNNDRVKNEETGEFENPNRTPVPLAAYIDRVIYNPYWNVTDRIRSEEILPEVKTYVAAQYKRKRALARKKEQERSRWSNFLGKDLPKDGAAASEEPTLANVRPETGAGAASEPTASPGAAADTDTDSDGDGADPEATPAEEEIPPPPAPITGDTKKLVEKYGLPTGRLGAPAGSQEELRVVHENFEGRSAEFPYLDPATGEIDVSVTHPDYIPGWYARNNYEVMYPGKKWEYVRMVPGSHNALGYVKVIFPNLFDVYLHDTNARPLFSRTLRAFSHGCMRMEKPLEFAEYILRRDGLYEKHNVPGLMDSGEYMPVFLDRQIPVYVEYYSVRVDDDGRANFLADVYDYDKGDGRITPPVSDKVASKKL